MHRLAETSVPTDPTPETASFRRDLVRGLARKPRSIPAKHFYDARGAELFERICELPEYYPTRTELGILRRHAGEMSARLGPRCIVVEYGSGASLKTRILLDHLASPAAYVPVDISREQLASTAAALDAAYQELPVLPVCADYTADYEVPRPPGEAERTAIYFPGSTIGNFTPDEARHFLAHAAEVAGPNGALLIGIDLEKDAGILNAAYDDSAGVTAEFNKNLLVRANRELGADFRPERFRHVAFWDARHGRVEMHLESACDQRVRIDSHDFALAEGERIHTENSYKYSVSGFAELAERAGWRLGAAWTDADAWFAVLYLEVVSPSG